MSLHTDPIERLRSEVKYWLNEYEITGKEICKLNAESAQRKIAQMEKMQAADEKQGKLFSD